jgi:hypothetical protein
MIHTTWNRMCETAVHRKRLECGRCRARLRGKKLGALGERKGYKVREGSVVEMYYEA